MQGVHTSTKNVGVSEKVLDGHVDDLMWASKDGNTMFLVSGRAVGGKAYTFAEQKTLASFASRQPHRPGDVACCAAVRGIITNSQAILDSWLGLSAAL
jgi:hypothetical protein